MSQSLDDSCKESSQIKQQPLNPKNPITETCISDSEIEKLYLKIKEDWL